MNVTPARYAHAVVSTANPLDLATRPDLEESIKLLLKAGVSEEHSDWWHRTGKIRVAGNVIDTTQCARRAAMEAVAAVMHARILLSQPVDDAHEVDVYEWAVRAVVWQSGRDLTPVYRDIFEEGDSDGEGRQFR